MVWDFLLFHIMVFGCLHSDYSSVNNLACLCFRKRKMEEEVDSLGTNDKQADKHPSSSGNGKHKE